MAGKRSSAKGKNVPRKGRAARGRKMSPRKARSKANKRDYRAAMSSVSRELAGAPEPEKYVEVTDAIIDDVLERISDGMGLRASCRLNQVHVATVRNRFIADEALAIRYARARESKADAWADDIVEGAEAPLDYDADGANVEIAHRKHVADVKKWLMGKYHVRQYGDKVTTVLEGNPDKPVQTINRQMTLEQMQEAFADERKKTGG
jgi:hypothetical protein